MSILVVECLATLRQIEILEDTLKGLPGPEDVAATRSSELQRLALEKILAELAEDLERLMPEAQSEPDAALLQAAQRDATA